MENVNTRAQARSRLRILGIMGIMFSLLMGIGWIAAQAMRGMVGVQ